MHPRAALMKVRMFPAMGADPTTRSRHLPPTIFFTQPNSSRSQKESLEIKKIDQNHLQGLQRID